MNIPERVYLRGHHLGVFVYRYPDYKFGWDRPIELHGTYYDERTQRDITDFYSSLASSPNTEIEVTQKVRGRPDSVCVLCNNYDRENNKCRGETASPLVDEKDRLSLFGLELKVGDVLMVREVVERFNLKQF